MTTDLIVLDNSLVTSAYNLTLNEHRLIYCVLKQIPIKEKIDPNTPFYINRDDFIQLGANPDNVAREIRQATKDLRKRAITIPTPVGEVEIGWLKEVLRYDKNAEQKLREQYPNQEDYHKYIKILRMYNLVDSFKLGEDYNIVARIIFDERVVPLLSDLRENFTQFLFSDVTEFSSVYSFRIYQLMMQWQSTGYCRVSIDKLRYMLVLKNKYSLFSDLKRWVIDTAIDEINDKSPYMVKYDLIKTGRKFTHLELKFKEKKAEIKQVKCPNTIDMFEKPTDTFIRMTDAQLDTFASKLADLSEVQAMANVGEEMPSFKARLRSMLKDPEKQKKLAPYLVQVGFKAKTGKS